MGDTLAHGLWNCCKNAFKQSGHWEAFQAIGSISNWKAGM